MRAQVNHVKQPLYLSVCFVSLRETGSPVRLKNALVDHVLCSPKELLKLSVPSLVYAVQNNMAFLALSNLDAAVYQVQAAVWSVGQSLWRMVWIVELLASVLHLPVLNVV